LRPLPREHGGDGQAARVGGGPGRRRAGGAAGRRAGVAGAAVGASVGPARTGAPGAARPDVGLRGATPDRVAAVAAERRHAAAAHRRVVRERGARRPAQAPCPPPRYRSRGRPLRPGAAAVAGPAVAPAARGVAGASHHSRRPYRGRAARDRRLARRAVGFRSRRFLNQTEEKGKAWERKFEIYPDSGMYREAGRDSAAPTVAEPLDDAAFLYWIRTVPLEIGKRYEYRRYFRPERNPVIVEVLKRDRVSVAGKKWNAIVIRPRIPNGGGIFAEKADARMWLSDEQPRIMLALQSNFSFGQVTL